MAARSQVKREAAEAAKKAADEALIEKLSVQHDWLNGWPRMGDGRGVLIGSGVHCVCCGKCFGVTCVAIPEDWEPPGPTPTWPFGESDCPLCATGPL